MSITITNPGSYSVDVTNGTDTISVAQLGGQVSIDLPADGSVLQISVKEVIGSTPASES